MRIVGEREWGVKSFGGMRKLGMSVYAVAVVESIGRRSGVAIVLGL